MNASTVSGAPEMRCDSAICARRACARMGRAAGRRLCQPAGCGAGRPAAGRGTPRPTAGTAARWRRPPAWREWSGANPADSARWLSRAGRGGADRARAPAPPAPGPARHWTGARWATTGRSVLVKRCDGMPRTARRDARRPDPLNPRRDIARGWARCAGPCCTSPAAVGGAWPMRIQLDGLCRRQPGPAESLALIEGFIHPRPHRCTARAEQQRRRQGRAATGPAPAHRRLRPDQRRLGRRCRGARAYRQAAEGTRPLPRAVRGALMAQAAWRAGRFVLLGTRGGRGRRRGPAPPGLPSPATAGGWHPAEERTTWWRRSAPRGLRSSRPPSAPHRGRLPARHQAVGRGCPAMARGERLRHAARALLPAPAPAGCGDRPRRLHHLLLASGGSQVAISSRTSPSSRCLRASGSAAEHRGHGHLDRAVEPFRPTAMPPLGCRSTC